MNKYWFKPKRYGYGFFPISWEGWIVTILLVGVILLSADTNGFFVSRNANPDIQRFILDTFILTMIFTLFSKDKMKEDLRWRWNNK